MRRNANREERGGRLLSALAAAVLLTLLLGIIHRLYHCEYTDTDTPNDCFAVSAATGETALPKMVCLTFDDGPDARYTSVLLDGLRARNIKVSFFLLGEKVEQNPDLVRRMQEEGHLVGNHTYHHVQLDKLSDAKAREEILKTNNLIYETTGRYPQYMRPPFGAWKKNLELRVEMMPVFWTIDTLDWKVQNTEQIIKTVEEKIKDGSIILMHDEYKTTVEAALRLADSLKEKGYELVKVDELIMP